MQLVLSTEAAPDLSLPELEALAGRRGFAGLELVAGHAHGVDPHRPTGWPCAHRAFGFRAASLAEACGEAAARMSAALRAPVVANSAGADATVVAEAARVHGEAGGTLLLSHGSDPAEVQALREMIVAASPGAVGLAWEIDPQHEDLGSSARVLAAAGPLLRYARMRGGGPESVRHEGMGIGALMARLALARYSGPLVLAPSTPSFHYVWSAWLGRTGGWGCGSKTADPSLVQLDT